MGMMPCSAMGLGCPRIVWEAKLEEDILPPPPDMTEEVILKFALLMADAATAQIKIRPAIVAKIIFGFTFFLLSSKLIR